MQQWLLALRIAFRYFFAPKRFHAVQVVSLISSIAVGVVVMATICVLSVFNGYEQVLLGQLSVFDPPLVIERHDQKVFSQKDSLLLPILKEEKGIKAYSFILKSQAAIETGQRQEIVNVCGVDRAFTEVNDLSTALFDGSFVAKDSLCTMGIALHYSLFANVAYEKEKFRLYIPKRGAFVNPLFPMLAFRTKEYQVGAITEVRDEAYDQMLFIPLGDLQDLLRYHSGEVDRVLILPQGEDIRSLKEELQKQLGEDWKVLNREEQEPELVRLIAVEKWMTFFILFFILLLASFNIIGATSMLILEKKRDLSVYAFLGASAELRKRIFFLQGLLVSLSGILLGIVFGGVFIALQKQLGFLTFGEGTMNMPYPVALSWTDLLLIGSMVLLIAVVSYFPVYKLVQKKMRQ